MGRLLLEHQDKAYLQRSSSEWVLHGLLGVLLAVRFSCVGQREDSSLCAVCIAELVGSVQSCGDGEVQYIHTYIHMYPWLCIQCLHIRRSKEQIEKIVKSLGLKISARDSRHTNPKAHLFAICSQWLPLAKASLSMVVKYLPSPLQLTEERVERLLCGASQTFQSLPLKTQLLKDG